MKQKNKDLKDVPETFSTLEVSTLRGPAEVEYVGGGEGIFLADEPGNHGGGFVYFQEAVARDAGEHEVDVLLRDLLEDARAGCCGGDAVDELRASSELHGKVRTGGHMER